MEILDYAIQMERDGYRFYMDSSEQVRDPAARSMMLSLAKDEQRHESIIQSFKDGCPAMRKGKEFASIRNVFEALVREGDPVFQDTETLKSVLKKGIELERQSEVLYGNLAEQSVSPANKKIWHQLQKEEQKHEKLLALTLEHIEAPRLVLETSEFLFYDYDPAP